MEGGVRTWGRGAISWVPGDPLCHRQTSPGTEAEGEGEGPSGETVRCSCDCGLCGVSHTAEG